MLVFFALIIWILPTGLVGQCEEYVQNLTNHPNISANMVTNINTNSSPNCFFTVNATLSREGSEGLCSFAGGRLVWLDTVELLYSVISSVQKGELYHTGLSYRNSIFYWSSSSMNKTLTSNETSVLGLSNISAPVTFDEALLLGAHRPVKVVLENATSPHPCICEFIQREVYLITTETDKSNTTTTGTKFSSGNQSLFARSTTEFQSFGSFNSTGSVGNESDTSSSSNGTYRSPIWLVTLIYCAGTLVLVVILIALIIGYMKKKEIDEDETISAISDSNLTRTAKLNLTPPARSPHPVSDHCHQGYPAYQPNYALQSQSPAGSHSAHTRPQSFLTNQWYPYGYNYPYQQWGVPHHSYGQSIHHQQYPPPYIMPPCSVPGATGTQPAPAPPLEVSTLPPPGVESPIHNGQSQVKKQKKAKKSKIKSNKEKKGEDVSSEGSQGSSTDQTSSKGPQTTNSDSQMSSSSQQGSSTAA